MRRRCFIALGMAGLGLALMPGARAAAAAPRSRFIEELTWIEVRDAIAQGAFVAILPTGGSEQNGPHMAIGKHNVIVRYTAGEIAARLGNALVAPVLAYVPEGGFDPPQGHMNYPGTVGVSQPTFAAILREAATGLALAGFKLICFVGDHGDSQAAQQRVAATLTRLWRRRGIAVANLGRYYAANGEAAWLTAHGLDGGETVRHAGLVDTSELMAIAPEEVRDALLSPASWPPGDTGAGGNPSRASRALGAQLLELKIAAGVAEAREVLARLGR
jgi:creatinine amidohydrolase